MDNLKFISEHWQWVLILFGTGTSSGWLGYILAYKSRKLQVVEKAFRLQEEMIDSVKLDFEERFKTQEFHIEHLKKNNIELSEIVRRQDEIITKQNAKIALYEKEFGKLK